jgi:hypothetical protein
MPKLIKFQEDYSDEFDVYGFVVLTYRQWEQYQEMFKCLELPKEYYFGTNEMIIFSSPEEIMSSLKVSDMTIQDEISLKKLFPPLYSNIEWGWTPFEQMLESISIEDYERIFPDE